MRLDRILDDFIFGSFHYDGLYKFILSYFLH